MDAVTIIQDKLKRRIEELEAALETAIEGWADGANYKGEYLKAKHMDAEGIAKARAVLENRTAAC